MDNVNDLERAEVRQNKAIRGYIIRCLVKGYNNTALTRQLSNAFAGRLISPSPVLGPEDIKRRSLDIFDRLTAQFFVMPDTTA